MAFDAARRTDDRDGVRLRVGYDIVEVGEVAESLRVHGRRYVARVFTQAEAGSKPEARRLAGTFAAKEAVVKALDLDDHTAYDWRAVEIGPGRSSAVRLSGALADHARVRRVREVDVSIALAGGYASAVAMVTFEVCDDGANVGGSMDERIRAVIAEQARLGVSVDEIGETDDLYAAGMTSHASVNLMLGLESEFDVEFPDDMLTRSVFESVASIRSALEQIALAEDAA